MFHRMIGLALGAFALTLVANGPAVAQTAPKCGSAKQKATGKKASAILSCYSKAATKGVALDPACTAKADGKFMSAFAKTEGKGGCATTGDAGAVETKVDNCAADINDDLYTSGVDKCAGSKIKAAGKKASAIMSCYAKATSKGTPVDPACITKADAKFMSAFAKAEAKGGCNTTGDAGAIETKVDNCTADLADDINPPPTTTTTSTSTSTTSTSTSTSTTTTTSTSTSTTTTTIPTTTTTSTSTSTTTTTIATTTSTTIATTTTTTTSTSTSTSTTTTTSTSTTTTTVPVCSCCGSLPSMLTFTTGTPGGGATGDVLPRRCAQGSTTVVCTTDADCSSGVCRGHLDKGGLYFGGGQNAGIGLPANIPDKSTSYTKITSCSGSNPVLTATVAGDIPAGCSTPAGTPAQGLRHCTAAGCLFGVPLPIPNLTNPATSTCIVNEIATSATGTATCATGATTLNLPLTSHVYLTGSVLGTQSCAICTGGTVGVCGSGTCSGGSRNGMTCTPESTNLTSHDCPPPAIPPTFIGDLPIPFNLSTGTQSKTSFPAGPQARVFCGFCADTSSGSIVFNNPAQACTANTDCPGTHTDCGTLTGDTGCCAQHSNGAFRNAFATTITETGADAGACVGDGASHPTTLVSVFCIPPSYDPIVDPSGELPGPGAVSLPGTAQFIP